MFLMSKCKHHFNPSYVILGKQTEVYYFYPQLSVHLKSITIPAVLPSLDSLFVLQFFILVATL